MFLNELTEDKILKMFYKCKNQCGTKEKNSIYNFEPGLNFIDKI
jgi:hypothetical protein